MDLGRWLQLIENAGVSVKGIEPAWLESHFNAGASPVSVANLIRTGVAPTTIPPAVAPPLQVNTGLGFCPQCHGTNIKQFDNIEPVQMGKKLTAAGIGLFVWPVLLAIPFVGNKRKVGTSRGCLSCGNRWPV